MQHNTYSKSTFAHPGRLCIILVGMIIGLSAYLLEGAGTQVNRAQACDAYVLNEITQSQVLHQVVANTDYARRMQQQWEWTDAVVSQPIDARGQENRLRSRRYCNIRVVSSTRWQLDTAQAAAQKIETEQVHRLNRVVACSRTMRISLPPQHISYPFHWFG